MQPLVPELYVSDFAESIHFYVEILGFAVIYQRPIERFAYLGLDDAELMIEQPTERQWLLASLEHPFGRGINLQVSVADAAAVHDRLGRHGKAIFVPLETRCYERNEDSITVRQFVVADPDGYLLRFAETLKIAPA